LVIRTVPNHRICTSVRGSRLHQASMPFGKKTKLAPTEFRWVSGAPSEPLVTASAPHVETKRIADKSDSDSVAAAAAGPPLPRCASVAECVAAAAGADQTKWPSAPRFIILGVQKCGTTTLWDHLAQHPRALRAQKREPHFFDRNWHVCQGRDFNFPDDFLREVEVARQIIAEVDPVLEEEEQAEAETFKVEGSRETVAVSRRELQARYLALFQIAELSELSGDKVVGESSPRYLFYGKPVLQRIKTLLPLVRLIVMLRNPTDRAYSQYSMTVEQDARRLGQKFVEGKTFEELVQADLDLLAAAGVGEGAVDVARLQTEYLDRMPRDHGRHGFVGRGLYAAQLEILFEVFPPEQVLVLTLEQLKGADQTQTTMSSVYKFVGLPPFDILQGDPTPRNTRDYAPMADVRTFPHVDSGKLVVLRFLTAHADNLQATKERLKKFYAPHNARLYQMLGRNLGWD